MGLSEKQPDEKKQFSAKPKTPSPRVHKLAAVGVGEAQEVDANADALEQSSAQNQNRDSQRRRQQE